MGCFPHIPMRPAEATERLFKPSGVRRVFGRPGDGIGRTIIGESEDVQRRLLLLGEKAGLRADKNNLLLAPALCFGGGQQGRGEFFVKGETEIPRAGGRSRIFPGGSRGQRRGPGRHGLGRARAAWRAGRKGRRAWRRRSVTLAVPSNCARASSTACALASTAARCLAVALSGQGKLL